ELTALDLDARLRRRRAVGEDLLVAGIEADQDELTDVVEESRGRQLVATGDVGEAGEVLGGMAGRDGMTAEALRKARPRGRGLKQRVGRKRSGDGADPRRRQRLDGV